MVNDEDEHYEKVGWAIGVSSRVCKGKGAIAFWAGPNLVVWARYVFWARGHVATNCRSKNKKKQDDDDDGDDASMENVVDTGEFSLLSKTMMKT
ncbi:hypothetical protein Tco_1009126 [Tanacetum coccineum]